MQSLRTLPMGIRTDGKHHDSQPRGRGQTASAGAGRRAWPLDGRRGAAHTACRAGRAISATGQACECHPRPLRVLGRRGARNAAARADSVRLSGGRCSDDPARYKQPLIFTRSVAKSRWGSTAPASWSKPGAGRGGGCLVDAIRRVTCFGRTTWCAATSERFVLRVVGAARRRVG